MQRRHFLPLSAAALAAYGQQKPRRVGLIGTGWYGKSDLFRLMQVAPVEVVSPCDVDNKMLAECADMVVDRQASKTRPLLHADYREQPKAQALELVFLHTPDTLPHPLCIDPR